MRLLELPLRRPLESEGPEHDSENFKVTRTVLLGTKFVKAVLPLA